MNRSALAVFVGACALCTAPVRADEGTEAAFGAAPPQSALADGALRDLRGKFVPSSTAVSTLSGNIVYFGIDMQTTFRTPAAGTSYAVDARVGIDLSGATPSISIATGSSRSGATGAAPGAGTIAGSVADGRTTGVTQTIQIVGNGNDVTNGATVDVTSARPLLVLAPADGSTPASCGAACVVTLDPATVGVAISLPGGSAAQRIGPTGIVQSARVTSDFNVVSNRLGLTLAVQPRVGGAATGVPLSLLGSLPPPSAH